MFEDIIYALGIVMMLCGVFFVCYIIFCKIMTPKEFGGFFAVIPGESGDEYLPEKVYAAFVHANLLTFHRLNEVIVLDLGVSEKIKTQCRNIMHGKGEVEFCTADKIRDIVNRI
ncbi:MAG: hypothetical protein NC122_10835 [Faecalibacterium sp.]|nr:hypothetical protein [Ruminococcus sp.]MCM1392942.1 hypothetical protein [Ruminococcus sp.]MCM1486685.1 hypothetical protein [Faecalibacterium sp.]